MVKLKGEGEITFSTLPLSYGRKKQKEEMLRSLWYHYIQVNNNVAKLIIRPADKSLLIWPKTGEVTIKMVMKGTKMGEESLMY